MVQFGPQGMTRQLWCKSSDMLCYICNKPLCIRYIKTCNYNRTDTMPISYTFIMIRSAGAKFPPEYSDTNLVMKTQCVKQGWLRGNCRASPVVSVSSKTWLTQLIQSSLQQPLQHNTVVAVFPYVLLLLYLPNSLSLILILQSQLIVSHFLLTLNRLRMSVLNGSYDSFIGIMGLELSNFNAWNKP